MASLDHCSGREQLYPSTDVFSLSSGAENEAQSLLDLQEPRTRAGLEDIEFGLD